MMGALLRFPAALALGSRVRVCADHAVLTGTLVKYEGINGDRWVTVDCDIPHPAGMIWIGPASRLVPLREAGDA